MQLTIPLTRITGIASIKTILMLKKPAVINPIATDIPIENQTIILLRHVNERIPVDGSAQPLGLGTDPVDQAAGSLITFD